MIDGGVGLGSLILSRGIVRRKETLAEYSVR